MPQAVLLTLSLFNSRSLLGERFTSSSSRITATIFQFSLPAWGAITVVELI